MLEKIVQQIQLMPREAVLAQVQRELAPAIVGKKLPKPWHLIEKRLLELQGMEGRTFQFAIVDFILWINGVGGGMRAPVPQPKKLRDLNKLVELLPYKSYTFDFSGNLLRIFPHPPGTSKSITASTAEAILRQDTNHQHELYIQYESEMVQLMWVDEDGLASIKTGANSYQVKPLRQLVS